MLKEYFIDNECFENTIEHLEKDWKDSKNKVFLFRSGVNGESAKQFYSDFASKFGRFCNYPAEALGARQARTSRSHKGADRKLLHDAPLCSIQRPGWPPNTPPILILSLFVLFFFPDSSSSKSLPLPASSACSHLPRALQGLCATAIKKVCRKMGISKWPFR